MKSAHAAAIVVQAQKRVQTELATRLWSVNLEVSVASGQCQLLPRELLCNRIF
jgi:hypothetical protein